MMRPPKNNAKRDQIFAMQRSLIAKHFPVFQCKTRNSHLQCIGSIKPFDYCDEYKIRIEYTKRKIPKVFVSTPQIEHLNAIHIYRDGHLCLYDPRETPWSSFYHIHETIIPWTCEWIVYYELFKIHGVWFGSEASHEDEKIEDKASE